MSRPRNFSSYDDDVPIWKQFFADRQSAESRRPNGPRQNRSGLQLMKPRIAVLGCGYWGSNHIRTLKALGALHAVSDLNRARAEGFASEQDCLAIEPEALFVRDDIDAI